MRDPEGFETRAALFASWTTWATAAGEYIGTRTNFLDALEAHGFEPIRPHNMGRGFRGLRLPKPAARHWADDT